MKKPRKTHDPRDSEFIKRAKRGDQHAFTLLVRRYEETVYSFAFKVCRDKEKAAETLQDTFINVYRKLHQFNGRSKFSTWLYSLVVNNCLMKRRVKSGEDMLIRLEEVTMQKADLFAGDGGPGIPAWKETPLDTLMDKELWQLLDESILRLPVDYQVVFILRDVEGLSAEETGKIMKLSVPAVKSRLRRARLFLREQLNEYMTA